MGTNRPVNRRHVAGTAPWRTRIPHESCARLKGASGQHPNQRQAPSGTKNTTVEGGRSSGFEGAFAIVTVPQSPPWSSLRSPLIEPSMQIVRTGLERRNERCGEWSPVPPESRHPVRPLRCIGGHRSPASESRHRPRHSRRSVLRRDGCGGGI